MATTFFDLNLIGNIWHFIRGLISNCYTESNMWYPKLKKATKETWHAIQEEWILESIDEITYRFQSVLDIKGLNKRY